MSETQSVDLTKQQQDLLLQGLRYVRRSTLLDICEPTPEVEENRKNRLQEIAGLVEQLNGSQPANTTAGVSER